MDLNNYYCIIVDCLIENSKFITSNKATKIILNTIKLQDGMSMSRNITWLEEEIFQTGKSLGHQEMVMNINV